MKGNIRIILETAISALDLLQDHVQQCSDMAREPGLQRLQRVSISFGRSRVCTMRGK